MTSPEQQYSFTLLGRHHNRAAFSCGASELDVYLQRQALQDVRRNLAAVFVLVDNSRDRIAGYYTLSACSLGPDDLPDHLERKLPRYESFPGILIGRLAVDVEYQGQSFGGVLLYNAFQRAVTLLRQVAAMAVVVDAKDDRARSFYERFGFHRFEDDPYRLFILMKTIIQLLEE